MPGPPVSDSLQATEYGESEMRGVVELSLGVLKSAPSWPVCVGKNVRFTVVVPDAAPLTVVTGKLV